MGETACDPLTGTDAPFRVALTALVEVQVSVELPPGAIEVGLALIAAVGAPLAFTVTFAWAEAVVPDEPVAMKVYVVVAVGETVWEPLTGTDAPFRVALTALVDVQVSVELPPVTIDAGFALIAAVGAPLPPVTVTVAWPQSVAPAELRHVMRYVVVAVGETTCDPFNATIVPFKSALTQLNVVHVSVELPPDAIEVGLALMPAAGGPLALTVTVLWAEPVVPDAPVAMKVYVVVAVGETVWDPLTGTDTPFRVALTALVDVQVSVELPPGAIEVGLALIAAVGAPLAVTVTLAWAEAVVPDEPVAMKVYVVVAVGETVWDPLTGTDAPFRVALTALVDAQVSVELPPVTIEVGFALIAAVGAPLLAVTVTLTWPQSVAPAELRHVMRYVVVTVGETNCDPFNATGVPFKSALTQLNVVHVSVELPPDSIEVGFARMPAAGACARAGAQRSTPIPINQQAGSKVRSCLYSHRWRVHRFETAGSSF